MEYTGLELTKAFEGCRLTAYQDIAGTWTIGYGHTAGVTAGINCTQEQADAWLAQDIQTVVDQINRDVKVGLTQGAFNALVDFGFNLGVHALKTSTLWKKLNAGDIAGAAAEFPRWDHAGGKEVAGLLRRRQAEQREFLEQQLPAPVEDATLVTLPEEKPMLPFIMAALPSLLSAAPDLIRIFGNSPQADKNAAAAEKVVEIAKQVTNTTSGEEAVAAIQADPAVAAAFREQARKDFLAIEDLADKRVEAARVYNAGETPLIGNWKFVHLLAAFVVLASAIAIGYILYASEDATERTMALQTLLMVGFVGTLQYFMGSSSESAKKTDLLNKDNPGA